MTIDLKAVLPVRQRVEMTFITATSLPLLIALAEIGSQDGVMLPATAAALVGCGVLSVLIFPLTAVSLHRTGPITAEDVGISQAEPAAAASPISVPIVIPRNKPCVLPLPRLCAIT